jgi:hypothetical protein
VGKSFVQEEEGEGGREGGFGYNVFRVSGERVDRRFRMKTSVVGSVWDGRPSFQLQYGEERHLLGALRMYVFIYIFIYLFNYLFNLLALLLDIF